MSLFDGADKKRKKAMATGFKWGRREHKFEMLMTRCLWIAFFIATANVGAHYFNDFEPIDYLSIGVLAIIILCLVFRLLTEFCHRLEKKNFDPVRFGHKKKSLWKVFFK